MKNDLRKRIFSIRDQDDFNKIALEIFNYQRNNNPVYGTFTRSLGNGRSNAGTLEELTFLPVEFFRNHKIITGGFEAEAVFESSGTTGVTTGRHYVCDLGLYEESFMKTFRLFYGDPAEYMIAALLPSYIERAGSSLVYMADRLIKTSCHRLSGFYKENPSDLLRALDRAKKEQSEVLLIGVSFALLDLAEEFSPDLSGITVMETGGMKGRRKELTRQELHKILKEKFNVQDIHSEYGMTELLSQAYSPGDGMFYCPPWMKILIRDPHDPLTILTEVGRTGGINIIDLANINSCSFIATGDLGRIHEDGGFEVIGRFDNSDIRGCNLLIGYP
jgi:hypothetical protein